MAPVEVICLTNGAFQENCYIVIDRETKESVVVDPGEDSELFLRRINYEGVHVEAVWLTHAHLDHILGVKHVVEQTGAPIYLHPDDRSLYDSIQEQASWLGLQADEQPQPGHELAHGGQVAVGESTFEVRHVPGHSPGGVAFVGYGLAIVGDAIFDGSIGRTDLPGGDSETLLTSIREQLLVLPDETLVYPGHGPATTIGKERKSNPFLSGGS